MKKLLLLIIASLTLTACATPPKPEQPHGERVLINPSWVVIANDKKGTYKKHDKASKKSISTSKTNSVSLVDDSKAK